MVLLEEVFKNFIRGKTSSAFVSQWSRFYCVVMDSVDKDWDLKSNQHFNSIIQIGLEDIS